MLYKQKHTEQYIRCLRMLLIPHFYLIYKFQTFGKRRSKMGRHYILECKITSWSLNVKVEYKPLISSSVHTVLHRAMLEDLRGTMIEKQIKRLGAVSYAEGRPTGELDATELHDHCLRLVEALHQMERYKEMAQIVFLAVMQPVLQASG